MCVSARVAQIRRHALELSFSVPSDFSPPSDRTWFSWLYRLVRAVVDPTRLGRRTSSGCDHEPNARVFPTLNHSGRRAPLDAGQNQLSSLVSCIEAPSPRSTSDAALLRRPRRRTKIRWPQFTRNADAATPAVARPVKSDLAMLYSTWTQKSCEPPFSLETSAEGSDARGYSSEPASLIRNIGNSAT